MTEQENDIIFLLDTILLLADTEVAEGSDMPFNKTEAIAHVREMYDDYGYSKGFVDQCLKKH